MVTQKPQYSNSMFFSFSTVMSSYMGSNIVTFYRSTFKTPASQWEYDEVYACHDENETNHMNWMIWKMPYINIYFES